MKRKIRKSVTQLISVIIFLIGGLFIYDYVSEVMRLKEGGEHADLVHSFYSLEKDSLDVLVLGSSISYYGIQPNVLWNEYGFTSFDMSSPSQTIPTAYYLLKDALRFQHPKVVVLESYGIWNDKKYYLPERLHVALDAMPMSLVKLEAIWDLTDDMTFDEKKAFYIPFLVYHSRWKDLTEQDFQTETFLKGSVFNTKVYENEEVLLPEGKEPVPEIVTEYFEKIEQLCKENDIELFVVQLPVGRYGGDDWPTFTDDMLSMQKSFFEYLDAKEIPYVFYQRFCDFDLDWKTDYADSTHLNAYGAVKASLSLGEHLKELYSLPDHRDDPKFSRWDEDYERYTSLFEETEKEGEE